MHRFFVPPAAIFGDVVRFPPATAEQIARVLRLRPGDEVAVLDGAGTLYRVILRQVTREAVEGQVTQREMASGEPRVHLALYAALPVGASLLGMGVICRMLDRERERYNAEHPGRH